MGRPLLTIVLIFFFVLGVFAPGCSSKSSFPPVLNNVSEGGQQGNGSGGGGSSGGKACVAQGGQCLEPGDLSACPSPSADPTLCGAPENDAMTTGLFCCFNLNDAGSPDVVAN
jgi:hypothetical protein